MLKPSPHVINMIINMKEKHKHILSDLDVLTNEFRKVHHFTGTIQFSKESIDIEKDGEEVETNGR